MKYLSLLIIVFCLAFTWHLSNMEDPVSLKTHSDIQSDLSQIIQKIVMEKLPGATNFQFSKLYTQTLNPSTVQASFAYSFKDANAEDQAERAVDGTALLTKDTSNPNNWVIEEIKVDQTAIEFEKGLTIKAGQDPAQQ